MNADRKTLSKLRLQIVELRDERERLENFIFRPKSMMRASLVSLPNFCGKEDCRCKKGFPHGPYAYLSDKKMGKTRMTYVKKRDLPDIRKKAEEYVRFQKTLARLRKINGRIRSLLEKIRDASCEDVDTYKEKNR